MSTSSVLGLDQSSQMSRSSGRSDWFTEKDLHVAGNYDKHVFLPPPKKEVMFLVQSVCLSVCLFVCLSVGLLANLWPVFDEIFYRGRAWLKDQVIQFWWPSGSRFRSGSPKSEIRILWIAVFSGGLFSLSASSYAVFLLKWYMCVHVDHTPVLYQNNCSDWAGYLAYRLPSTHPVLHFKEIRYLGNSHWSVVDNTWRR